MGNSQGHVSHDQVSYGRYKQTKLSKLVQYEAWTKAIERTEKFPNEVSEWVRIGSSNFGAKVDEEKSEGEEYKKNHRVFGSPVSKSSNVASSMSENRVTLLPIHQACYLRPPALFILSQLQTFPRSISMQDDYDRMPLHIACMECADLEVIKTLLFWQPRCAMVEDKNGCLPIHLSILSLYKHHPGTLIIDDYDSVRILELLLKAYPEGSSHVNCRGDTPLTLFHTTNKILQDRPHYPGIEWAETVQDVLERDTKYWRSVRPKKAKEIVADYLADKDSKKLGISSFRRVQKPVTNNAFEGTSSLANTSQSGKLSIKSGRKNQLNESDYGKTNTANNTQLSTWIMLKEWDDVISCAHNTPNDVRKDIITKLSTGESWSRLPLYEACRLHAPVDVICELVRAYPDALTKAESIHNRLPLHVACIENLESGIITALLVEKSNTAKAIENKYSAIPLHFACSNGASVDVVLELLRSFPDGCKVADKDGWLPLHHACAKGASSDIVDVLLCSFPEGALSKEQLMGRVPLHFAAMKGSSTSVVEALLKISPESINSVTLFGSTPLMMAEKNTTSARDAILKCLGGVVDSNEFYDKCQPIATPDSDVDKSQSNGILASFISARDWRQVSNHIKTYPDDSAKWIESKLEDGKVWKRLPIHEAIHLAAPHSIVALLVNSYLQGVSLTETLHNRLPLHVACAAGSATQVIDTLIAAYPAGAMVASTNRYLPIHLACANGMKIEGVRSLLTSFPDGLKAKDSDGWLPIHHLCSKNAPSEVVELLLDSYPESVRVKELSIGRLPIHLAAYKGSSVQTIELLLNAYPESAGIGTFTGSTPASLASRSQSKDMHEIINLLSPGSADVSSDLRDMHTNYSLSVDDLKYMISQSPLRQEDVPSRKGKVATDLTVAIVSRNWRKASSILDDKFDQAFIWNEVYFGDGSKWHRLPLHEACRLQPPQKFIEKLLKVHPEGIKSTDHDGWLPLHLACESSASSSVIKLLLKVWPDGARALESQYGYLPLHVACCFGSSVNAVEALLLAFPESLDFRTNTGVDPITLARQCTSPNKAEIIALLQKGVDFWYEKSVSKNEVQDEDYFERCIDESEEFA